MRKRYRILLLAAIVAALVVPVGFALSLESVATTSHVRYTTAASTVQGAMSAPVLMPVRPTASSLLQLVPDGAKLFAVGTALFAVAAIVRRAV